MPLRGKWFAAFALGVEGLAIAAYCVLRVREHVDPQWTRDSGPLSGTNKYLGQASILLVLGGAVIALIGMIFDKDRLLGILALCLVIPIIVLMGLFQGIW
jgi:uncharacterized membrane protein